MDMETIDNLVNMVNDQIAPKIIKDSDFHRTQKDKDRNIIQYKLKGYDHIYLMFNFKVLFGRETFGDDGYRNNHIHLWFETECINTNNNIKLREDFEQFFELFIIMQQILKGYTESFEVTINQNHYKIM